MTNEEKLEKIRQAFWDVAHLWEREDTDELAQYFLGKAQQDIYQAYKLQKEHG